jgi:hypothetical protein
MWWSNVLYHYGEIELPRLRENIMKQGLLDELKELHSLEFAFLPRKPVSNK